MKILLLVFVGMGYQPTYSIEVSSFTDCSAKGREIVRDLEKAGTKNVRFTCKGYGLK